MKKTTCTFFVFLFIAELFLFNIHQKKIEATIPLETATILDIITKVTIRGNLNTTVILTDILTENQYAGMLEAGKDLIYKNLDYGTYTVSCINPLDVNFIEANIIDNQFILSAQNPEMIVVVDNKQIVKPGFYSIVEKNIICSSLYPVITVDPHTVILAVGSMYDVLTGVTAMDITDRDITYKINVDSDLNTNQAGVYIVTYTVTNSGGYTDIATRTVTVVDISEPVITVDPDEVIIARGSAYDVLTGVTAMDDVHGDLTSEIIATTDLNVNQLGIYQAEYTVSNILGYTDIATRTIIVADPSQPVIIVDPRTVTIEQEADYDIFEGVIAIDYIDGDITAEITTTPINLDLDVIGIYVVTYSVTNTSNVTRTNTRTITVEPAAPVITVVPETVSILQGYSSFNYLLGVTAMDRADGIIAPSIIQSTVDINIVGNYTVTYSATNSLGKTTIATRTVIVTVLPPPPIMFDNNKNKEPFIDQIANNSIAKNNYLLALVKAIDYQGNDISSSITVINDGGFDPSSVGNYTVSYEVTDSNTNTTTLNLTIDIWNFVKIVNGEDFSLALGSNGSVWTWGYNPYGQRGLGNTTTAANYRAPTIIPQSHFGNLPVIDIAAGYTSGFALNSAGQTYSWGNGASYQLGNGATGNKTRPSPVKQPTGVKFTQISCFYQTGAGLGRDGNIYTWGYSGYGATGSGNTNDKANVSAITSSGNFKYISQGTYGGAAVNNSGQVYTWGSNIEGIIGIGSTGGYNYKPTLVPNLNNIKEISYGTRHILALANNGNVYVWGDNGSGRLGLGNTTTRSSPVLNPNLSNVIQVNAGYDFSQFRVGNNIYSCGYADYGELFGGNTTIRTSPTISNLANVQNNVGYITGRLSNAFILSANGKTVYGIGNCTAAGQQFGSTATQATSTAAVVPWTFTPPAAP